MEHVSGNTITYSPNYRFGTSNKDTFLFYVWTLKKYKKFIWVNFLKHFKASYQKSFLRILWIILIPLIPVSVYVGLQLMGLLRGASDMPKILYVVIGMTFWQLFANALVLSMGAAQKEKAMLKKINMPFIVFHLSSIGNVIFDYLIRIILIWGLLIIYDQPFTFYWLMLPFMLLPLVLLGFSLGMFLSFFSIYFNDVKNIVDIGIRYALFATGVLFPIPKSGVLGEVLSLNPVYILLDNLRNLLVFGHFSDATPFWVLLGLLVIFLMFVLKKLYLLEPRMREYL